MPRTLDVRTLPKWREWLADHHASESEIWVVFHKRHTGRASIAYEDAVNEALCFGWIDSLIKRLDDSRYARKFTPRKPDSRWSDINRRRYEKLKASGRLQPAGMDRPPGGGYEPRPARRGTTVPKYIRDAIRKDGKAWDYFERLAPSHRRYIVGWVDSAKQQETKDRRLREAIRVLAAGQKLGLK